MRTTFIRTLFDLAERDEKIFLITADLGYSVVEEFAKKYPNRFLNVGIAEQNAVGISAGLAMSGWTVYFYSIIPFVTMRCFEQVRVDVAYQNTNVKIVGVGAGLSYGPAGATHHSIEDIAIMRSLPNMRVLCPGDPIETRELVKQSARLKGPMYLRLGKNGEPKIHSETSHIEVGRACEVRAGSDLALISTSNMLENAVQVADKLFAQGIKASVLSMHTIKPLDVDKVREILRKRIPVVTMEEHSLYGGLGTAVAEVIAEAGDATRFLKIALPDEYTHKVGSQEYLRKIYGLDVDSLFQTITRFIT